MKELAKEPAKSGLAGPAIAQFRRRNEACAREADAGCACPSALGNYLASEMNVLPDGPTPVTCMITSPSFAQVKWGAFEGSE